MLSAKFIPGFVLLLLGIFFVIFREPVSKGMFKLYRKLYTRKNLGVMLTAAGILLIIGGLAIMFGA